MLPKICLRKTMTNKENISKIINLGVAVLAMIAIICISVSVTVMMRPLYYFDIEYLEIAQKSGISAEACKLNYDTLIDYNLLGGDEELVFPTLKMSETGRIHFEEVKEIFVSMQVVALVAVLALVCWAVYVKKKGAKKQNCLWMKYTFPVTIAVAVTVALAMVIDWQWAFTTMHQIFFDNDYWIFNPYTDPVIRILPEEFFFHCGFLIVILTMAQIAVLRVVYRRLV